MSESDVRTVPLWCVETIDRFRNADAKNPAQIAALAESLAASGVRRAFVDNSTDVASTGGPASLTTFIAPLMLCARDVLVPKVGVPGRPAGVVDALGIAAGYRIDLDALEFERVLNDCGFVNALASRFFAPDDRTLFRARQVLGAQDEPSLVIASLLSKKIAVGLQAVTFDVRVMPGGNFGSSKAEASRNISLMHEVGSLLGIDIRCVMTSGSEPAQPMLGRSEAVKGLIHLVDGCASEWLEDHYQECAIIADLAGPTSLSRTTKLAEVSRQTLSHRLDRHLRAQGGEGLDSLRDQLQRTFDSNYRFEIEAGCDGTIAWDLVGLRSAVTGRQGANLESFFADQCGLELLCRSGEVVTRGQPIAIGRTANLEMAAALRQRVLSASGIESGFRSI
jgi:thymidine phosphorylase